MAENIQWRDQPWRCSNCKFILGVVSSDGTELRIKWRDLFIVIVDAKMVKEICRRCGLENKITGGTLGECVQS
jgi:hypothetical protein